MGNLRWYGPLLVLVLVALVGLRVAGVVSKNTITHDEGISYLAAAGHQQEYHNIVNRKQHPVGAWVKAAEWKKFITPNKQFAFKKIGYDLAHLDIHPPLYFWLLYVWSLLFGVHVWTGPSLNIVISLTTALFLFRLALYVLGRYNGALIATFIWAMSPAVISISFTARHYDLLALATVIFVDQIIRYADLSNRPRLRQFVQLSIITAAGMLTHYYFLLVIVGAAIFLTLRLARDNIRHLSMGLVSIGVGCVIFIALHPNFYLSFSRSAAGTSRMLKNSGRG